MAEKSETTVVIGTGKKLSVGSNQIDIVDATSAISFVDLFTEARQSDGIVHLSMGAGVVDANNTGSVVVSTRIRMPLGVAQSLHTILGNLIREAQTPPDKAVTN